jgi:hypothetical protein
MKNTFLLIFAFLFLANVFAQKTGSKKINTHFETYTQSGILSFSQVSDSGKTLTSIPRFTFLGNYGRDIHVDFGKYLGIFTGLETKNTGFITRENNLKVKRRIFGLGVPVALKIGNMEKWYIYGGGEYQFAFNYKMKTFDDKGNKTKYKSDWGGTETPFFLPSVFVGINWKSIDIKAQYYLQNFIDNTKAPLNTGFSPNPKYYANYNASVFFLQVGVRGSFFKKWLEGITKMAPTPPDATPKKKRNETNVNP